MSRELNLFNVVPTEVFRPLSSTNRRLHWYAMKDLYTMLLEYEVDNASTGTPRYLVMTQLQNVIHKHADLWLNDDEEVAGESAEGVVVDHVVRANVMLNRYISSGWLAVESRGYKDYFTMPYVVGHLVSSLLEIADDRPIATTGKLKQIRAGLVAVLDKPQENADTLQEITRDAVRLSRHLNNIRGAIKAHYEQTLDSSLREIVDGFFDEYLPNVHSRDYMRIKTSENPLLIKNEILDMVNWEIRYDKQHLRMEKLLAGYRKHSGEDEAQQLLEADLRRLETVFQNIPRQLDAIDELKLSYEQRVDTAISYARLKPQYLEQRLKRLVSALGKCSPNTKIKGPLATGELIGGQRFPVPRKPRIPPKPRTIQSHEVDDSALEKSRLERAARKAAMCTEKEFIDFIERCLGNYKTGVLNEFPIASIKDYFLVMNLHRIAAGNQIGSIESKPSRFLKLNNRFLFTYTDELYQGQYVSMTKVVIQKR